MYPLLVFYRNIDCRKFIEYRKLFGTVFGTDIDTIISKSSIRYTTLSPTHKHAPFIPGATPPPNRLFGLHISIKNVTIYFGPYIYVNTEAQCREMCVVVRVLLLLLPRRGKIPRDQVPRHPVSGTSIPICFPSFFFIFPPAIFVGSSDSTRVDEGRKRAASSSRDKN